MVARLQIDMNSSGSEGDEAHANPPRSTRNRYHRHAPRQIQVLEEFFRDCPHPNDTQRKELGRAIGMEPLQVKFWFQNKRNQMKTQHEHRENMELRIANEKLRTENIQYRETLANATCPDCGGPLDIPSELSIGELQLKIENAELKEEIDRISTIAAKYMGKPFTPPFS